MLTIGGKDVNFDMIVASCFAVRAIAEWPGFLEGSLGLIKPYACESYINRAKQAADDGSLTQRIANVFQELQAQGLRGDARLALLGYPYLEQGGDYFEGYPVGQEVRDLGDLGDRAQAAAVAAAKADGMNVMFLDSIKEVSAGHEPDGSPFNRNPARWLYEFADAPFWDRFEWYHPNPLGHQAYAEAHS